MKRALALIGTLLFVLGLFLVFKSNNDQQKSTKNSPKSVITTIYPLYYLTQRVAGNEIEVTRLIKSGQEIHSFLPTPADMILLEKSQLFVSLGEELEPWVSKLSSAVKVEQLSATQTLKTLKKNSSLEEKSHHDHAEHGHEHAIDPHVWLDAQNDIQMTQIIASKLSKLYPQYSNIFQKNKEVLIKELQEIDNLYRESLKNCNQDTILVGHNAFGYMQKRYGFDSLSIMGIFAESAPNAGVMANLINNIKDKKIKYLLEDPLESSKSAKQLANDANLTLLQLYTLGNISIDDQKSGEDMISLMQKNLKTLKMALECHQ